MLNYPERFRIENGGEEGGPGAFIIPREVSGDLVIIAAEGMGWAHVSVSLKDRCPSWREMCMVKDFFFGKDVWAMQLHSPEGENINVHPFCLHLWRPLDVSIPVPPVEMA